MRASLLAALVLVAGCGTSVESDPGLEGLAINKVAPGTIVPGTKLVVKGASFVDAQWGDAKLHLEGQAGGHSIDESWPATFVDFSTMNVAVDAGMIADLGGDADFSGTATVEVVATSDGATYTTKSLSVSLTFREVLTPTPSTVQSSGVIFVNDQIEVDGDGFLLGGDEGQTVARISGCFTPDAGGGCAPIAEIEIPMMPSDPLLRTKATFPFSPKVAGIQPGAFTGQVTIVNQQTAASPSAADAVDVTYDMVTPQLFDVCVGDPCTGPVEASLGQYVFIKGGGFVGGDAAALTELELDGTFTRNGSAPAPVLMTLIPEFVEGRLVRYVLNTNDALGTSLDLRADTGTFTGTITPIITYGADEVRGEALQTSLAIAPVKQVVYLDFRPTYVEGLRDFGLRGVDNKIRDKIFDVCRDTYRGINIEFRAEPPTDFALYEHVELTGVDPNDQGLFGYDNTPGKDNGNVRLYDQIGGVNATTQSDGYAGYGGVFLRSLMGFSKHPGSFAKAVPGADVIFDQIFDPFRADVGGEPVRSSDLTGEIATLEDGDACPGDDRSTRISCAIYVLGNLVGGTLAHELGHSLGLANPYAEGFHNAGDAPNRLMDNGGDRPFLERAVMMGLGPGEFCDDEYTYLRMILPSKDPAPDVQRAGCY
jgi:hypothetical protein